MDEWVQIVSSVGFPIAMCGILCYYIFKVETKLIDSINQNTLTLSRLIDKIALYLGEEEDDIK